MAYLHAKNIVHFDLKSANLLLGYRDRRAICKVADFGLSKQKRDTYVSNVTSQRGTLPWIAPEIIKTPHAVTERVRARGARAQGPLLAAFPVLMSGKTGEARLRCADAQLGDYLDVCIKRAWGPATEARAAMLSAQWHAWWLTRHAKL